MKLSLDYTWSCEPEAFWALYYDPKFTVRLHLDALGSTTAEVVSQEGDLTNGLVRTLRYGQRPNMPGPVRKIFGEEVVTTEVSTYDPATTTTTFTMTPGTMADKTQIEGRIALAREATARSRRSPSTPGSRSSVPGQSSSASLSIRPATCRTTLSPSCEAELGG